MMAVGRLRPVALRARAVAVTAAISGGCGLLSVVPVLPALQAVLLLVFILSGVGSAVMCWVELPPAATIAAVVGLSIAAMMAVAVTMAWLQVWYPVPSCLVIGALVSASGAARLRLLHNLISDGAR
ncbi:hypothetical protein ACNUDN_15785 [Mycobacterium sp. smrl_JER01]|uniref:hypothetical protein n=1 Tax=Mycobacterium sp. smrl_JER01 TaxID=3402633 RepID=UPI003ACD5568